MSVDGLKQRFSKITYITAHFENTQAKPGDKNGCFLSVSWSSVDTNLFIHFR